LHGKEKEGSKEDSEEGKEEGEEITLSRFHEKNAPCEGSIFHFMSSARLGRTVKQCSNETILRNCFIAPLFHCFSLWRPL
jgi:hypothetical protein